MYLDPSFGGMLLQVIVVIAAVGGAVVYSLRKKISKLFSKNGRETSDDAFGEVSTTSGTPAGDDDLIDMFSDDENRQ